MRVKIESKEYNLEYDPQGRFVAPPFSVAYCTKLAEDFMPVLLDPWEHGSRPCPPEFVAYRLTIDPERQKLCILYEVYWRRQDCTWKELNKDHDHDYEQIQIHFNLKTGNKEKIVISSVGPMEYAGHGIEIYSNISKAEVRDDEYITSLKEHFPWGGDLGQKSVTQIREIPMEKLTIDNVKPVILIVNCYHAFVGLKKNHRIKKRNELNLRLERLSNRLLEKWYYRHFENRFGHDISKPINEPHIMYYPPPEDFKSRFVYSLIWLFYTIKRLLLHTKD